MYYLEQITGVQNSPTQLEITTTPLGMHHFCWILDIINFERKFLKICEHSDKPNITLDFDLNITHARSD